MEQFVFARILLVTTVLLSCWVGADTAVESSADFHNIGTSPLVVAYLGRSLHKCYTQSPLISVSVWLTLFRVEVEPDLGGSSGLLGTGLLEGVLGDDSKNCRQFAEQHTIQGRFTMRELAEAGKAENMCGRTIFFRSYKNGSVITANGQTVWKRDDSLGAGILVQLIPHPLWLPDDDKYSDSNIVDLLLGLLSRLLGLDLTHVLQTLGLGNILGLSKDESYTFIPSDFDLEHFKRLSKDGKGGASLAGREMKKNIYTGYLSTHDFDQKSIKNVNGESVPVQPLGSGNYQIGNKVVSSNPSKYARNGAIYGEGLTDKSGGLLSGLTGDDGKLLGLL